jgi:hypothetical protein
MQIDLLRRRGIVTLLGCVAAGQQRQSVNKVTACSGLASAVGGLKIGGKRT